MRHIYSNSKIVLILLVSLLASSTVYSQYWSNEYDSNAGSTFIDMSELDNGNIACLMNASILVDGTSKILKILGPDGTTIRDVQLEEIFDNAYCLLFDGNSIYIGGDQGEIFQVNSKLAKFTIDGTLEWSRIYNQGFISSISSFDEGLILGGYSRDGSTLMKVSKDGEPSWSKTYEMPPNGQTGKILIEEERLFAVFTNHHEGIVFTEVNFFNGDIIWHKGYDIGLWHPLFNLVFNNPVGAVLSREDIIVVAPGIYHENKSTLFKISKDGTNIRTKEIYHDFGMIPFDVAIVEDGNLLIAGSYKDDLTSASIEKRDHDGNLMWRQRIKDGSFFRIKIVDGDVLASGCAPNFFENSDFHPYIVKMSLDGDLYNSGAELETTLDKLGMCDESSAIDISDHNLILQIDGDRYHPNVEGKYVINKPPGIYDIEFDLPPTYGLCQSSYQVSINDNETTQQTFVLNQIETVFLEVGLTKTELLKNQSQTIFIEYANIGNIDSENTSIILTKDDRIEILETSIPYEVNSEGQMVFDLNTLAGDRTGRIAIDATVSSNLLESTHLDMQVVISSSNMQSLDSQTAVEVKANCDSNDVKFELKNTSNTETFELELEYLIDGYTDKLENISVLPNSNTSLTHTANGQAVTLKIFENQKLLRSTTYEGCDRFDNNLYTVNVSPQTYHTEKDKHRDIVSYEVVTQKDGNRIFQDNLGLGRDRILQPDTKLIGYNLRFTNQSDTTITNLKATIDLFHQRGLDPIVFRASSHEYETNQIEGHLEISVSEPILPYEEFHIRLQVPLQDFTGEEERLNTTVNWKGGNATIDIASLAYNNLTDFFELDSEKISPHTSITNGHIFGESGLSDFIQNLTILPDDSKLVILNTSKNTGLNHLTVYKVDQNEKVIWQKVISFEKKSGFVSDVEILDNGNIMLVGVVIDEYIYDNNSESYSFYKVISQDGDDIAEKIWQQGSGANKESRLTSVQQLDNGNIALFGFRYYDVSRSFFRLTIDENFIEQNIENIYLPTANFQYPIANTKKYKDYVVHSYLDRDYPGTNISSSFAIYFDDGTTYTSFPINYKNPSGDSFRGDQYIFADGYASIAGRVRKEISPTESEYCEVIIEYNYAGGIRNIIEVMPEARQFNIHRIATKGDNYLIAAYWRPDSLSNGDLLFMEVDKAGEILWMDGRDMGSREYTSGNIISTQNRDYCTFRAQSIDQTENLQGGYIYRDSETASSQENSQSSNIISIYPNPTSNRLNIKTDNDVDHYAIISAQGTLISRVKSHSDFIDVSHLPTGKYFLTITLINGKIRYEKFVKI